MTKTQTRLVAIQNRLGRRHDLPKWAGAERRCFCCGTKNPKARESVQEFIGRSPVTFIVCDQCISNGVDPGNARAVYARDMAKFGEQLAARSELRK